MKKNHIQNKSYGINRYKGAILLFICFTLLIPLSSYGRVQFSSKNNLHSLHVENKTIKSVFEKIELLGEYLFIYQEENMDLDKMVSLNMENKSLNEILSKLFSNTDLSYTVSDLQIMVSKKSKASKADIPQTIEQKRKITGVVVDETDAPIPGVIILIKGSTRGVITDIDGVFEIEIDSNDVLKISFIGYEDQEVPTKGKESYQIKMAQKVDELSEVTVVAFAKQKKESVIASVSTVKPSDLKVPSSNLTTAFAGRIAGLISYQRTGEPGQDNADFFIRGVTTFGTGKSTPLILIDGVEMTNDDLARLTTDDIASFSIMKDANATALYGARGANGVILVTTKEGKEGALRVQFRAEGSYSSPTETIKLANPTSYMKLHNEAVRTRNPLAALPYSTAKIVNTERGFDPLRYPAIDWEKMLFKNHTFNQRYNLNLSGGGKIVRYYIAAAYNKDNGIINMDKRNNFNNNISIDKYVLRSNVNVNLTKSTEAVVRLYAVFDDYSGPLDGGSDLYNKARHANPVLFQPYYPADKANEYTTHILFGNAGTGSYLNPYAEMLKGYRSQDRSNMSAQFELKQDLNFITSGLAVRGLYNVSRFSLLNVKHSYKPFFYELANMADPGEYKLTPLNPETGTDYLDYDKQEHELTSSMYFEGATQYNREFADKHSVSGLLVFTLRENMNGNAKNLQLSLPMRNLGFAGRFTYGYDSRYFIETNFGYNGSERFAKNERFGFFPSIGGGWILTNEAFMAPYLKTFSKIKLKATYGLVGNDQIGAAADRFFYLSQVNMNNSDRGFTFGEDFNYSRSGISISRYEDPYITWEISKKMNLGLEFNLLNSLEVQLDYFTEKRTNVLQSRSDIPSFMGLQAIPQSNVGEAKGSGIDISVDYSKTFSKDLWAIFRGNFTYATSEFSVYDEPDYVKTPWRSRIGNKISQQWGYVAERLFLDEEEVKNSPVQTFGEYGAGDIKYKDINRDMKIDENDLVPIGYPTTPEIIYGFGVSAGYKGIDFSCFFQGSERSSFWIDPSATAPFVNDRALLKYWEEDHWSIENKNIFAIWPRLSNTTINNNQQRSTWFMRDGSFLRLKTVEIGYTFPKEWVRPLSLSNVRVYGTGNNLFVFSKFKMWDPEMAGNGLAYPLQRVFNIGVTIEF